MSVRNPTSWVPESGQGYVSVPGQNYLITNNGNYLVTNIGNYLVTNGVVIFGKYPTNWSASGV